MAPQFGARMHMKGKEVGWEQMIPVDLSATVTLPHGEQRLLLEECPRTSIKGYPFRNNWAGFWDPFLRKGTMYSDLCKRVVKIPRKFSGSTNNCIA